MERGPVKDRSDGALTDEGSDSEDELDIEKHSEFTVYTCKGGVIDDIIYNVQDVPDSSLTKLKKYFGFR